MWAQLGNAPLEFTPGNEDGFNAGDLAPYAAPGHADFMLKLEAEVEYTSAGSVTGMTEAQALAYLDTLTLDLRFDMEARAKSGAKAQDPSNIFHPLQAHSFKDVRLMALRLLEKEMEKLSDTTNGLRRSFSAGSGSMFFTLYASIGQVTQVDEWLKLYGVGPDMLKLMKLTVRAQSDGLANFDTDLVTNNILVTVKTDRRKVDWDRAGFLPMRRQYQPGANQRRMETHGGSVPLDVVEVTKPLATTDFTELTVEVGDDVVTDKETPAEIRTAYIASSRVGSPENTIASYATEFYTTDQQGFETLRSGPVVVTQETYEEEFDVWATSLPAPGEAHVIQLIKGVTKAAVKPGQTLHFVNALAASGLIDGVPGRLLPAAGIAYCRATDPRAQMIAGLRATLLDSSGRVDVKAYLPPAELRKAAQDYRDAALERSSEAPNGNIAKMDMALNTLGRSIPAFVVDEVKGFPSSTPGGGAESVVYRTSRQELVRASGLAG
ncbi:MAG TPA: hypothetical protein VNA24_03875 [Hyalangium sp.]|nr:hypothetical protein [Hyalangium sp.]